MCTYLEDHKDCEVLSGVNSSVGVAFEQDKSGEFKKAFFEDRVNKEKIPTLQSTEFTVLVSTDEGEREIIDSDCRCAGIRLENSDCEMVVEYINDKYQLRVHVIYRLQGELLYKEVMIENRGPSIKVLKVWVEDIVLDAIVERGGVGQPVFVNSTLFMGLEHPAGMSVIDGKRVKIGHCPGKVLETGEALRSFPLVIGGGKKNMVEDSFVKYIKAISPRKPEHLKVYCDWGLHDELSPFGVELTEALTLEVLDTLSDMKADGISFDYYLMDAFWFDPAGDYTQFKKANWPNGFDRAYQGMKDLGLKFGLWYNVSGGIDKNPQLEPFKASDGHLCLACEEFQQILIGAIQHFIQEYDLSMLKFDFAVFDCDNAKHGHLLGEYAREATINGLIRVIEKAREANPSIVILAYNTFTYRLDWLAPVIPGREGYPVSPWWGKFCDMIYCGDPRPSEIPTVSLRDSTNCYTDHQFQIFKEALLPPELIDDHGVMVGNTGTVYWEGKNKWRDIWTLMVSRGALKSHFYGDPALLDQGDRMFMGKMLNLVDKNIDAFNASEPVLGEPGRGEVYGYSCVGRNGAFLSLVNPTFFKQSISWREEGEMPEIVYSSQANLEIHQSCDRLSIDLEPFTVIMIRRSPCDLQDITVREDEKSAVVRKAEWRKSDDGKISARAKSLPFSNIGVALRFFKNGIPWRGVKESEEIKAYAFTLDKKAVPVNRTPNVRVWSGCSWIVLYRKSVGADLQFEVDMEIPEDVEITVFEIAWGDTI